MKRCPKCYQVYGNSDTYCEVDGQRLLPNPGLTVETTQLVPDAPLSARSGGAFATGIVGVFTGVVLCGGVYLAYSYFNFTDKQDDERPSFAAQLREPSETRPAPARVPEAVPSPSVSPTEEEEPEASPEPSPQPQVESASARLNNGPVSTGEASVRDGAKVKTVIEMQDGSTLEVDAAWKDNQGVWYRQGSLVSFVEGSRVKTISGRAEPKPSPAANQ